MAKCRFIRTAIELEAGLNPGELDPQIVESVTDMHLNTVRCVRGWYEDGEMDPVNLDKTEGWAKIIEDTFSRWDEHELKHICEGEVYKAAYKVATEASKPICKLFRRATK